MSIALEIAPRTSRKTDAPRAQPAWLDRTATHLFLLSLWSVFLFLYGIHQGDLYRTEGLRAIVGAEMYRSGDWIVPRLYGEPILTKPPLFYWCIALTGHLFGDVTTWSARLPAALSGWIVVLIVYFTIRRYYDARFALLAALALPVSFLWLDKASSAEIDTMLVMWVVAAWACFLRVLIPSPLEGEGGPKGRVRGRRDSVYHSKGPSPDPSPPAPLPQGVRGDLFWWLAALLCVAAGVLTKWTAFLFFYAMAIPMLAWRRRLFDFFRLRHILAALLGAALVFAWLGAVVAELGWSSVWTSLWREGAPRVLHSENASRHLLADTALHPFKVLAIALPWSTLALWGRWRSRSETMTLVERSFLCWALAGTAMMTLFPDHNTRQSFSLVPAWTLLGVLALRRLSPSWSERTIRNVIAAGLLLWTAVKVGYVEFIIPARYAERPDLASQAAILRAFVPPPCYLQLRAVKDECLMFNYARPVRRVPAWDDFRPVGETYCVLTEPERRAWPPALAARIVSEHPLRDAQGDPLVVVRLGAASIP